MRPLATLRAEQADAAAPADSAWVSASAGTGKTQVLSARVLRLLLDGAAPERILCLTFTKAGAAEMQGRIFDRLAHWVRAGDAELRADLAAIRADTGAASLARARTLFARTLDARGGLSVQTLHAYAQSLLASFPLEAGVAPGFATLADRDAQALRARVLAESIEDATAEGDTRFLDDVGQISVARGESSFDRIAGVLIGHADALAALGPPMGFEPKLRRAFGIAGEGSRDEILGGACARLDHAGLRRLGEAYMHSGLVTYEPRGDTLLWWLAADPATQVAHLTDLCCVFYKKDKFERFVTLVPGGRNADPATVALADRLCEQIDALVELRRLLDAVDTAARHLRVGARLASAYVRHKRRAGAIDYDDMIARAAALLTQPGIAEWVRYKLDTRLDHLLVDEAQDTNVDQWKIVEALTDEFFAGTGARPADLIRTLFVVGDFKQAIFSFQGSDPRVFDDRREHFREKTLAAGLGWQGVDLAESFRSVPAVLEVVAQVVETLGHGAFGTDNPIPVPLASRAGRPGAVTLWPPLTDDDADAGDFVPPPKVRAAHRIAAQIAAWLAPATALHLPARCRDVRPEDILVLVSRRADIVAPLVAALHSHGVPVAGADRLRLTEPLAVQDCLALLRFALQPGDDLACACLLTSPFIGLDQTALFDLAFKRPGTLWEQVRLGGGQVADWLGQVLALADFSAPYEFLETILSGPLGGRARLLARLGEEARDAVQAVLAQALAFEQANAPTLQGFLAWMEGQDTDIKRDPDAPLDAVRIMTVHGAKGLQAPVVILADATRAPGRGDDHVLLNIERNAQPVPIFHGGAAGKVGRIAQEAAAAEQAAREEHWRLLYVALTRAEDLLFVGGALPRTRGDKPAEVPSDSWYARVAAAVETLGGAAEPAALWGEATVHRACMDGEGVADALRAASTPAPALPAWARNPAPAEARPPRPLSPSAIAADDVALPPPTPAMAAAARRGQLLHALFEHLPEVPEAARAATARDWLGVRAADLDDAARDAIAATALGIVADPRFAAVFGADALAEAPIAAVVDGVVVAGTVDRLLVGDDVVQVVDFKTGARVPADSDGVETYHLRQMAAYVAALGVIFPGRRVDAALLYTHDATLIDLPAELLATHRPRLGAAQATLGGGPR